MSKVLLIKNPIAGRDSKRIETGDIISAFKEYDIECFEKTTTCHGDAVEIAKKYSNDFDAVPACFFAGSAMFSQVRAALHIEPQSCLRHKIN